MKLYPFFWAIPQRLNFIRRRFGTLFHLLPAYTACEYETDSVPKRRHAKFTRRRITQEKEYNIQNKAKVLNQEP